MRKWIGVQGKSGGLGGDSLLSYDYDTNVWSNAGTPPVTGDSTAFATGAAFFDGRFGYVMLRDGFFYAWDVLNNSWGPRLHPLAIPPAVNSGFHAMAFDGNEIFVVIFSKRYIIAINPYTGTQRFIPLYLEQAPSTLFVGGVEAVAYYTNPLAVYDGDRRLFITCVDKGRGCYYATVYDIYDNEFSEWPLALEGGGTLVGGDFKLFLLFAYGGSVYAVIDTVSKLYRYDPALKNWRFLGSISPPLDNQYSSGTQSASMDDAGNIAVLGNDSTYPWAWTLNVFTRVAVRMAGASLGVCSGNSFFYTQDVTRYVDILDEAGNPVTGNWEIPAMTRGETRGFGFQVRAVLDTPSLKASVFGQGLSGLVSKNETLFLSEVPLSPMTPGQVTPLWARMAAPLNASMGAVSVTALVEKA